MATLTFELIFAWATFTVSQTSDCELDRLAASFRSFVAIEFSDALNVPALSFPFLFHLSYSTQNAAIGMRRDLGGTIKSTEIIRSCSPPRTTSPDCT